MPINIQEVKEKILSYLNEKGPSLPIPIAKSLNIETMLASAILSELINEKKITICNMRVGNSPLYFIPGQEPRLEPFSENLHGVEKETYNKLKENKILIDVELEPAERVALRHIKDFAFSLQHDGKTIWRYFLISEFEAKDIYNTNKIPAEKIVGDVDKKIAHKLEPIPIGGIRDVSQSIWQDIEKKQYKEDIREKMGRIADEIAEKQRELEEARQNILAKLSEGERKVGENEDVENLRREILSKVTPPEAKKILERPLTEKIEKKGKKPDKKQIWLAEVKEFIIKQNMELLSIEGLSINEVTAKVRSNSDPEKPFILIAIDKKKLAETDLTRAYKKSLKLKLPYYVAAKGELSKKVKEKIDSFKALIGTGNLVQ